MIRKIIFITSLIVFSILVLIMLLTVPPATSENTVKVSGKIIDVYEGEGTNDIVFKLKDNAGTYFINRGLEKGLRIDSLQLVLLNEEADLYYVKSWIDPGPHHVAKVAVGEAVIYDDIK